MKNFAVKDLKESFFFDAPVYLDEGYIILNPDTPVTESVIRRLKEWDYEFVFTKGQMKEKSVQTKPDGEESEISDAIQDGSADKTQVQTLTFYTELIDYVGKIFTNLLNTNQLNVGELSQKVKDIINFLRKDSDALLMAASQPWDSANYIFSHSVNTAILSIAVGERLRLPPHRIVELGLGALLHDVGMMKLPASLYQSNKKLTKDDQKTIIAHTILGHRMLKALPLSESVLMVALEHQERLDGSGYPKRLTGDTVSLYARIVAVTTSYDAMISKRPFKESLSGHKALLTLLKTDRSAYDEKALMGLVYCLSLYPLGSHVLLSNKVKGIVCKANPNNPREPAVRITESETGERLQDQIIIHTSKEKGTAILQVLE